MVFALWAFWFFVSWRVAMTMLFFWPFSLVATGILSITLVLICHVAGVYIERHRARLTGDKVAVAYLSALSAAIVATLLIAAAFSAKFYRYELDSSGGWTMLTNAMKWDAVAQLGMVVFLITLPCVYAVYHRVRSRHEVERVKPARQ